MAYAAKLFSKRAVAHTAAVGSPVGGWNARDALSNMPATDAITMQNWFPATSDVFLRLGSYTCSWNMPGAIETLMDYVSPTAEKLFAVVANGGASAIYDVTAGADNALLTVPASGGPFATVTSVVNLTNARLQYVNMQTIGSGGFLLAVNGANKLVGYDGTVFYRDGDLSHDITGVDTATIVQINVHKFRVWMIQVNSLDAWYLSTSSISGPATRFPLAGVARSGGYLVAMATWTIDAGYGVDDHACFITSKGEVIVYNGTDPASATTWQLVGVWQIGAPIGRRCFVKWAGDLLIITQDGLYPMSGALQSSRTNPRVALTEKIQWAISAAISGLSNNFGWQIIPYPKENMLLLNVPVAAGSYQEQYVMNTITKSWCDFQGWNANCWELYKDNLFFGGQIGLGGAPGTVKGVVALAWTGHGESVLTDPSVNSDVGNRQTNDIIGNLQQAFSYYKGPTQLKRFTLMRPLWSATISPVPLLAALNVDFDTTRPITNVTGPVSASTSAWETSSWETTPWAGGAVIVPSWQGATGLGYCASPHYVVSTQGCDLHLMATDVVYESGGIV